MGTKRFLAPLVGLAVSALTVGTVWLGSSSAVQFSDGRIAFNSPPRLVNTSLTPSFSGARNASFRFSIAVPPNAGEPLRYVEILPYSGPGTINFRLNNIRAYEGDGLWGGDPVPVIGSSLDGEGQSETRAKAIGVLFEPPLLPGETATIVLKSVRNPSFGGSFLYNVIAYPDPQVGVSHRMGFASFTINSRGGCDRVTC